MSFVIFPQDSEEEDEAPPALFGLGLGTRGLNPDERILSRPGHARHTRAIVDWLNATFGDGDVVAWAKDDLVRTNQSVPNHVRSQFAEYASVFDKYGEEMYAVFTPTMVSDKEQEQREATDHALKILLDFMFRERRETTLSAAKEESERLQQKYQSHFFPSLNRQEAASLLDERQYIILQGPPGTGKTRMALELRKETYDGHGRTIQFHPGTTYEDFVGGLGPAETSGEADLGFRFKPQKGALLRAAENALEVAPEPYLLHIDEINRADLANVLGETIFLLEPGREHDATVELVHDFGAPFHDRLQLPENLHILGTMNTADRSIAALDVAIRRRFAFASLWPQIEVVQENSIDLMTRKFRELQSIFVNHAPDDAFPLLPGHSYFLADHRESAVRKLKSELAPLLEDYLSRGYVAGFEGEIRSYVQSIESL
jgi:5-methylcytosine-specific restriction protein B